MVTVEIQEAQVMPIPVLGIIAAAAPHLLRLINGGKVSVPDVIGTIADKLGVAPTPEAIEEAYEANPTHVEEVVRTIDEGEIAQAHSDMMQSYHALAKGDQTGKERVTRLWRPICGITLAFGAGLTFICSNVALILVVLMGTEGLDLNQVMPLIALNGSALGVLSGVVGVAVYQRTQEKKAGVA
jgi:hypothetical protein